MMLFRRRDAWWDLEGKAARAERRRQRAVASAAFMTATLATGVAAAMWWIQLGVSSMLPHLG